MRVDGFPRRDGQRPHVSELLPTEPELDLFQWLAQEITSDDIRLLLAYDSADREDEQARSVYILSGKISDRLLNTQEDVDILVRAALSRGTGNFESLSQVVLFEPEKITTPDRRALSALARQKYEEQLRARGSLLQASSFNSAPMTAQAAYLLAPELGKPEITDTDYENFMDVMYSRYQRLGVFSMREMLLSLRLLRPDRHLLQDLEAKGFAAQEIHNTFVEHCQVMRSLAGQVDTPAFQNVAHQTAFLGATLRLLVADCVEYSPAAGGLHFVAPHSDVVVAGLPPRFTGF